MNNSEKAIPSHLGLILDGNRRWAKARGLSSIEGHKKGSDTLKLISEACLERGIKYLTVYAFSTENWARSKEEVRFLMTLAGMQLKSHIEELHKKGVRFIWLGCEEKLDKNLVKMLRAAEEKTKNNTAGTFSACFNYGGHKEIVDAVRAIEKEGLEVTEQSISDHLYGGKDIPPVDFLIRTSGENRISNFMLWRAAYSEMYFTDVLWPDFSTKDLDEALDEYASRHRRFGK